MGKLKRIGSESIAVVENKNCGGSGSGLHNRQILRNADRKIESTQIGSTKMLRNLSAAYARLLVALVPFYKHTTIEINTTSYCQGNCDG